MTEIVQFCPLCSSEYSRLFDSRSFRGQVVVNRICQRCGLVFQSPRMTEAESDAFYAKEYRLLQEGSAGPTERNVAAQNKRADSLLDFVRPEVRALSRHLDIGCSIGILLENFRRTYHNTGVGVEPGEAHRLHARREGLTVHASLDELEKAGEARFDLISMSHVLEHLPDPVGYLTGLRESILAPDGWLLLEVPNLYAHDSFEVAHLFAFSHHTLCEVLRQSGFSVVKFKQNGYPNSRIIPLFLTALCHPTSQPDLSPVHPERGVAYKRAAGMFRRRILARLFPKLAWLAQG
jgi:2-polyprenyl-3-methyl-5-hydroxy-6-metoxy-1,4-benzoquinol methylase